MNATPILDQHTPHFSSRKRLLEEHELSQSWRQVAKDRDIPNVLYVWYFAMQGKVPQNKRIARKLGIGVTINQLLQLPIQDMPPEILRLAFENRIEMTA